MSYKSIMFKTENEIATWNGTIKGFRDAFPKARILNVKVIKEESEQEQEQSPNQSLIKKHFSLIS